ncbi:MAG: DUF1987 domain-containing protein [Flavobacteriales bacterium]|nr:DUF1987 domain-containing protein [Flavobacteriales bacterium]
MERFEKNGTEDSPKVILDKEKGLFEISGTSKPENVITFYFPILDWIDSYIKNPNDTTIFNVKMDYFNTSSYKMLYDMLMKLDSLKSAKKDVTIKWIYNREDEDMKEIGEKFKNLFRINVELVEEADVKVN